MNEIQNLLADISEHIDAVYSVDSMEAMEAWHEKANELLAQLETILNKGN